MLNKLLQRQVRKYCGSLDELPLQFRPLIEAISKSYDEYNDGRKLLERIIDLSSAETIELKNKLLEETEEVKRAHAEISTLFRNLETVFFSIDIKNKVQLQMSPACEKVYGYTEADFASDLDLWYKVILDEDKPIIDKNYPVMLAGNAFTHEYRIRHKNGSICWLESKITPTLDENKELVRIDGVSTNITARKEADIRLRQSEEMMAQAQHIAKFGSWELELNNISNFANAPLRWSDEVFRIFGYTPGDVISNEVFFKAVHPDDLAAVNEGIVKAIKDKSTYSIDHRILQVNGEEKWVHVEASVVTDDSKQVPVKMIGIIHDITQRKQTEFALKQTEANLRTLLENTSTAYVLLDRGANILVHNQRAYELSQVTMGQRIQVGKNYLDYMHHTRRHEVQKQIERVIEQGIKITYEVNYKDIGEDVWLSVRMYPIFNGSWVSGLSIAAIDITDIKNAERQLEESNERYKMATRATNDVIWDWDILTNKIYHSENYTQLFGYEVNQGEDELNSWLDNIHPEDKEKIATSFIAAISNPGIDLWEGEYRYYRKNGQMAYIYDRGYITRNKDGQPFRMVGAIQDITAKKVAEIEHSKITVDLIQRNKDLEQFAYIVSHNLRVPVANIMGLTEVLQDDGIENAMKKEYLNGLYVSSNKLDEVIKDLNYILQVKREVNEKKELVVFSSLVQGILYSINNLVEKEQATIKTDFKATEMVCLKSYLHSIFYNLITNSIKYRQASLPPVIEIKSIRQGNKITLVFKDNGLGIDLERKKEQVFGLYKRFHLNVEGKGMGLFMVKTQVEAMGGKIFIKSEVGIGTEFIIEFEA